ncbi:MAG: AAA family ATPase [Moraxellaceae bacterium]
MLNSILIENFKSYKSQRLPLAPLTLMIGANASGKTNAIEAFRFLSWVVGGEKLSTIKNRINDSERIFRGDVRDLVYQGEDTFTLGAEVAGCDFRIEIGDNDGELFVEQEDLVKKTSSQTELKIYWTGLEHLLEGNGRKAMTFRGYEPLNTNLSQATNFDDYAASYSSEQSVGGQILTIISTVNGFRETKSQPPYIEESRLISQMIERLSQVIFFDLIPSKMRSDSRPDAKLLNTGANLAGVLHTLWQQPDQQGHILEFIQSLPEQDIKELKFYTDHRGRVELALIETFGHQDQEQSIELLSDGTLRVLAIAAALLSAPEGSTVVIEEVDNGVHPSRAKQLLTTMREHAERRNLRLLLSTHNPALMDALPDEALGDVVFCYRDPTDGDSRLVRLSDLDDYMGLVMQGSLGQLVTRGIVDRFVKNPVTPAEKKQKALDWLAMMQGDDE